MDWLSDLSLLPRVLIGATVTYLYIVGLTRLSGKRTVARMNSFDWIVNVAMGSLAASAILDAEILPAALLGMTAVVGLQWLLTLLTFHSPFISSLIKSEATLIVSNGEMQMRAMRRVRMNEDEVMGEVRIAGLDSIEKVAAMTFEPDGTVTVIPSDGTLAPEQIPAADESNGFGQT